MSGRNLKAQKRMAMELMKVGQRTVWLDPLCKQELAQARTRAQVRDLIEKGVIRRKQPRVRQRFVMPPQYMSRYRQRLLYDTKMRKVAPQDRNTYPPPTSGRRYFKARYWLPIAHDISPPKVPREAKQARERD